MCCFRLLCCCSQPPLSDEWWRVTEKKRQSWGFLHDVAFQIQICFLKWQSIIALFFVISSPSLLPNSPCFHTAFHISLLVNQTLWVVMHECLSVCVCVRRGFPEQQSWLLLLTLLPKWTHKIAKIHINLKYCGLLLYECTVVWVVLLLTDSLHVLVSCAMWVLLWKNKQLKIHFHKKSKCDDYESKCITPSLVCYRDAVTCCSKSDILLIRRRPTVFFSLWTISLFWRL